MENKMIQYNEKHYVVAANDIMFGIQDMTLQEARILRLLITQIAKEDKDLKTYICRIQDFAVFFDIPSDNLYRDIKDICKRMLKSVVEVSTGNPKQPWKMFHWIQTAEYDGNGNLTLKLSAEISHFVLELNEWFTKYTLQNIVSLKSIYSIRLYEILKCQDGICRNEEYYHEFSIDKLRYLFACENKYNTTAEFLRNTVTNSIKEINQKTDISLSCENIKTCKKITAVRIYIIEKIHITKNTGVKK